METHAKNQIDQNAENRLTLNASDLNIIIDFFGKNPKQKLYVVDARRVRREGIDPAQCTYELVLNSNKPPEVCYKAMERGSSRICLLSDPEGGFSVPARFQFTKESFDILETFRKKREEDLARERETYGGGVRTAYWRMMAPEYDDKRAVIDNLMNQLRTKRRPRTLEAFGHSLDGMPSENEIFRGIRRLPESIFEAIRLGVIPKNAVRLVVKAPGDRMSFIKAIDEYQRKKDKNNPEIHCYCGVDKDNFWGDEVNSKQWIVGITDGRLQMPQDPEIHTDPDLTCYEQSKGYRTKYAKHGFDVLEGLGLYLALEEIALEEEGMPLDQGDSIFVTLNAKKLTDKPLVLESRVATVNWDFSALQFGDCRAHSLGPFLRCRPWAKIDIP